MMARRFPRAALLLVGLFVLMSQVQTLRAAFNAYRIIEHPDEITLLEARFDALKRMLPDHGVVGYVSDPPAARNDPASFEARQAFKRYLITQYALVPLVLLRSADAEYVVGDFAMRAGPVSSPPGFIVVKDFGDGVILFRKLRR